MVPKLVFLFSLLLLSASVRGKCAPRTIRINYKSSSGETIQVFRMCGSSVCGPPVLTLLSACTKIGCFDGSRCNTCSTTIKASQLPPFSSPYDKLGKFGKYGVKFAGEKCPFLAFTSDWSKAGSDWYARNRFLAGCKPRVACRTRGGKRCRGDAPFDVAVTAQACYTDLYGYGNAPNLAQCIAGDIAGGVPSGEVYGVDCPARRL